MNNQQLQIQIYCIDGSTHTFVEDDPDTVNCLLAGLNPTLLFTEERITLGHDGSATEFVPPLVTRVDLVTERYSVWDFPFVLGAPLELTEAEYSECLRNPKHWESPGWRSDVSMFLDLQMVSGLHVYLWMEVVGGFPASRLGRVYSLFKERRLIFGRRPGGIGVLNLANLARFSVYPEPPEPAVAAAPDHPALRSNVAAARGRFGKYTASSAARMAQG